MPRPRDGANLPDSVRQARYQQMLTEELGRRPEGFVPAPPVRSWRTLIMPIVLMVVLAGMILGGVWLFAQWRSGEISFSTPSAVVTDAERAWRAEDRVRPAEEAVPMESEVEKMLEAQKPPVGEEAAEEEAETLE